MLEIKNVWKTFNKGTVNEKQALCGVNLTLNDGDFCTVIGGNGAGKSTTLNAIAGVWPVDCGQILIDGKDISALPEHKRAPYLGRVFQDPMTSLDPTMTIGKQIMEGMIWHFKTPKKEAWDRAVHLLEEVGITDAEKRMKNYPHQLSGGMLQRIMIGIATAMKPSLLIADEPTTAIDAITQYEILNELLHIKENHNTAMIFISHDLNAISRVADRIVVLNHGAVVDRGDFQHILHHAQDPYTKLLVEKRADVMRRYTAVLNGKKETAHA